MSLSINPYKTRLNHGNAYWMARLSQVVYKEDESEILKLLKEEDPGFINIDSVSEGNAQAIFVEHRQYFCMAFRGTDELTDWLDNLTATKTEFLDLGDAFHEGFYQHFEKIWQKLEEIYKDRREKNALQGKNPLPLFFTGHSLGGALATIATAQWVLNGDRQFTSTYTFGQPRAVTPKLARTLAPMCGSRFFRFHNNNDIIPRFPPRAMGFSHMGQIAYIDTDKEIYLDPGFWFRFQDKVRGVWDAIKESGIDIFTDHDIDDYLFAIKNWDMRD